MSARLAGLRSALVAAAILALPAAAAACPACGVGNGRNAAQFFWTTILLSLLPLALIVGGLFWLARHASRSMAEEFEDRDDAILARLEAEQAE